MIPKEDGAILDSVQCSPLVCWWSAQIALLTFLLTMLKTVSIVVDNNHAVCRIQGGFQEGNLIKTFLSVYVINKRRPSRSNIPRKYFLDFNNKYIQLKELPVTKTPGNHIPKLKHCSITFRSSTHTTTDPTKQISTDKMNKPNSATCSDTITIQYCNCMHHSKTPYRAHGR